ncbi:MAG: hypothetical protein M1839_006719 [Geoglossum umbratile]|nr:MAG: hypothetical protein M1839_006719 [Geoglossum umbratile]
MPPSSSSFTRLNHPQPVPNWMGSFTLSAPPNTDLWRKPPSRDTSTAPILYTALRSPFIAAEVTVSADWELEWDQGGLVIFAGAPPGRVPNPNAPSPNPSTSSPTAEANTSNSSASATTSTSTSPTDSTPTQSQPQPQRHSEAPPPYLQPPPASKWVKAGLEFYNNAPHASAVCAASDGADWALAPLFPPSPTSSDSTFPMHTPTPPLRVKLERVGHALWIWFSTDPPGAGMGGGWRKLREVTWFFWGVEDKAVRVGVYASRPAGFGGAGSVFAMRNGGGGSGMEGRGLVVEFEGLEIF